MSETSTPEREADRSAPTCYALLHRGDKAPWKFDVLDGHDFPTHQTRAGNTYAILTGHDAGKPFWVARLINQRSWVTVEREVGATSIEFENGSRFIFPA